jgi:hypothetical protein
LPIPLPPRRSSLVRLELVLPPFPLSNHPYCTSTETPTDADISPRSNPCTCAKVSNPGLYCGYCKVGGNYVVLNGYNNNNVFWCNKQGGCEDLGRRTSCVNSNGPCDGRDSG